MKFDEHQVGSVSILKPDGALVGDSASAFAERLARHIESPGARVVVSLGDVPYLDSRALEALLDGADALATRASTLKLAETSATCREIFELTGMTGQVQLFSRVEDAVKSFLL